MRIACIHVPQFALQCATRLDPSLRGAPIAVVSGVAPGRERAGVLHAPVVLACSRAAWAHGVRLGMTATSARSQAPDIAIVTADTVAERETVRAIADAVLAISPTVDVGGRVGAGGAHLAMYAEVPAKTRGTSFGDRLVELLADLGVAVRVGIADDRFTAWVAAAYGVYAAGVEHGPIEPRRRTPNQPLPLPPHPNHAEAHEHHDGAVVNVPRGGSAAFLAPRPLSLLAIPSEVQHMLEALGVRTLGEFASLPAPSIARPLEADYQALARGESGATLRPYHPEAPIREEIVVSAGTVLELAGSLSGAAAIAKVSRRIALRLAGRGRGAAKLEVAMIAAPTAEVSYVSTSGSSTSSAPSAPSSNDNAPLGREVPVTIDGTVVEAEEIARVLAPVLDTAIDEVPQLAQHGGWKLRVLVSGEAIATGETVPVLAEGSSPFVVAASSAASTTSVTSSTASTAAAAGAAMALTAASTAAEGSSRDHARTGSARPRRSTSSGPLFSGIRNASADSATNGSRTAANDSTMAPASTSPYARDSYEASGCDPTTIDPLTLVLSSSGSLFALAAPTSADDRRDVHRRTRRGKQRRTRPGAQVQPRLFDRVSHK